MRAFLREAWEVIAQTTKRRFLLYIDPLTKWWWWCIVMPIIVVFSMIAAYYEVYVK